MQAELLQLPRCWRQIQYKWMSWHKAGESALLNEQWPGNNSATFLFSHRVWPLPQKQQTSYEEGPSPCLMICGETLFSVSVQFKQNVEWVIKKKKKKKHKLEISSCGWKELKVMNVGARSWGATTFWIVEQVSRWHQLDEASACSTRKMNCLHIFMY